jgi:hypothetical protein
MQPPSAPVHLTPRLPARRTSPSLAWLACVALIVAASANADTPAFKSLRYDEDYRWLRDEASRDSPWAQIKYLPSSGGDSYLSLGGEVRERFESWRNPDFGTGGVERDDYLLQRLLLHADLHVGNRLRVFAQLGDHRQFFEDAPSGSTDEDRLDVHQAFVDLAAPLAGGDAILRLGRQEINLGSSRLVSVRETPNVRRSFDAGRATWRRGGTSLDLLAGRPVAPEPGSFDDSANDNDFLWGGYWSRRQAGPGGLALDAYYLDFQRDEAQYDVGEGSEHRHTLGGRLWGQHGRWDTDADLMLQFGDFAGRDIRAWALSTSTGYRREDWAVQPRFGLKLDYASGDGDPDDDELGTFNPLYPRAPYFGPMRLNALANLINVQPNLTLLLYPAVELELNWGFLWRASEHDAFYTQPPAPLVPGSTSDERYLGNQAGAELRWQVNRFLGLGAALAHFDTGDFLQAGGAQDATYFASWAQLRF